MTYGNLPICPSSLGFPVFNSNSTIDELGLSTLPIPCAGSCASRNTDAGYTHAYFNQKCVIVGCNDRILHLIVNGHAMTPPISELRLSMLNVEEQHFNFQLKERLKKAKVAHPKHGEALDLPVAHILKQDDDLDKTHELVGDQVIPSINSKHGVSFKNGCFADLADSCPTTKLYTHVLGIS
jgi:hypothetical protein